MVTYNDAKRKRVMEYLDRVKRADAAHAKAMAAIVGKAERSTTMDGTDTTIVVRAIQSAQPVANLEAVLELYLPEDQADSDWEKAHKVEEPDLSLMSETERVLHEHAKMRAKEE